MKGIGQEIISGDSVSALKDVANAKMPYLDNRDWKSANKLTEKISDTADGLTRRGQAEKVGKLYSLLHQNEAVQNATADRIDISHQLQQKGYSADQANVIADALVEKNTGQELTRSQKKALKEYRGNEVVNDIIEQLWAAGKGNVKQDTSVSDIRRAAVDTIAKRAAAAPVGDGSPVPTADAGTAHPSVPTGTTPETAETPTDSVTAADTSGVAPSLMSVYESTLALGTNAPADPVAAATTAFTQNGTVTNNQIQDILNSITALDYLWQQTGIPINGTNAERRAAVRQAIAQLAQQNAVGNVSQNNDSVTPAKEHISMEDFASNESPLWRNVDYSDDATKDSIMQQTHKDMVAEGAVVMVSDDVAGTVDQAYPDLRNMKKKERTPILKAAMNTLKNDLRKFLNGFKNHTFEFEVNGKVLDATLYNTGINEVMEKVTKEKANVLYSTEAIFQNSRYLYSTPDYDGNPNVYRWNYFYTPVQIGEDIVGVRIAVRDMVRGTDGISPESQIYNWGIKKDAPLDGGSHGPKVASSDVSSDASSNNIPQTPPVVNTDSETSADSTETDTPSPTDSVGAAPSVPSDTGTDTTAVGAAERNFTGRAEYQDLLSDENSQRDRPGDVRPVEVPKVDSYGRKISEFVGNAYGAEITTDEFTTTIDDMGSIGALGHDTKTNAESVQEAADRIKEKGMPAPGMHFPFSTLLR